MTPKNCGSIWSTSPKSPLHNSSVSRSHSPSFSPPLERPYRIAFLLTFTKRNQTSFLPIVPIVAQDFLHIMPRFLIRRNLFITIHLALACIIGRQCQPHVAVESVEEIAQMSCATRDVFIGVIQILHAMAHRRFGDELHEAHGSGL